MEINRIELKDNDYLMSEDILHGNEKLSDVLAAIPICGNNGYSKDCSRQNANDITSTGFYYGNDMTGTPTPYGYLIVIKHSWSSPFCVQFFMPQGLITAIYFRQQSGSWTDWLLVAGSL